MTDAVIRLGAALADRYRIERELGQGGMATVYLAEDLKHDRKVALKVLKPELAAVLGAERFVQEIKTTASLQHPHILPLFDSGQADGFLYYVMPYIDGETLRDKLDRETQLSVEDAVRITCEVADALDYAHRQGVIHRDIKPENILLRDGRPLVADFGIALAVSAAAGGRMTETGLSLGTPHYMSPEQATAEKGLTDRSDIYSLGAVLYEMLTGDPPHTGATVQAIVMKIVTDDAQPLQELRKSVPPHVAAATAKALEKVPADRFGSVAAFAAALRDARAMSPQTIAAYVAGGHTSEAPVARHGQWGWGALLFTVGVVAGWLLRPGPAPVELPVTRFSVPVPSGHMMGEFRPNIGLSPDGRTLAYFSGEVLYARALEVDEPERLGVFPGMCCPMFSPDGRWIVFTNTLTGGSIRGVAANGGPMVDVAPQLSAVDLVAGALSGAGIRRRQAGNTNWEPITSLDSSGRDGAHLWPQLLPGGAHVLYTALGPSLMWHGARVVVEEIATGARTIIAEDVTFGRFVPTGHIQYVDADGTLYAVAFDLERQQVRGVPFIVETSVRTAYWGGAASVAVSDGGTLAFVRGSSWEDHRLTWIDRRGNVLERVGRPVTVEGVRLSPDGRYAVTYVASNNSDIARFDLVTGEERRLTFDPETEDNPVWSPDGRHIAFHEVASAREHHVAVMDVFAEGATRQVYTAENFIAPRSWSADGSALVLHEASALLVLDLESGRVDTVTTTGAVEGGRFSPDGRWLAYTSSETGEYEIYVVAYPGLTRKQQVSVSGGRMPEWSIESGELFFVDGDTVMVAEVATGDTFARSTPRPLFVSADFGEGMLWYAVSADGQRILYPAPNPDAPAREIHVVLNWFEELRARTEP